MTMRLLQAVHVETFLLTYENNPWEKMCIMAVREGAPGIIVGYQHNVVPQASANMFVSRWEKNAMPMPDRILTVGDRPKEIMERYGNYDCGEIETSCGLRFEYLENLPVAARQRLGNILVVLEGIDDVYKMVNYVMKELGRNESFKVIIRTHPVLPFHCIQRKLDYSLDSLPNFGLSTRNSSLKDDIEWADVVMYWGTTVALEALCMGKPLIHYSIGTCLSYDPLFECWHLKWTVSDEESMVNILDEIYSLDDAEFYVEQNHALAYIRHYVFPVSEHGLSRFFVHDLLWAKSSQLN
jgi:surface carbohydrate biosynthesis protein (TIGR04326 family)